MPDQDGWIIGRPAVMQYIALSPLAFHCLSECRGVVPLTSFWELAHRGGASNNLINAFLAWCQDRGLVKIWPASSEREPMVKTCLADSLLWAFELDVRCDRFLRYYRLREQFIRDDYGTGRILVTGGCGELGSLLVPHLLELGYEVTVLDQHPSSLGGVGIRYICGDIRYRDVVRSAMQGCQAIIHLAGMKGSHFVAEPTEAWSVNVEGTACVTEVAQEMGVQRLIFVSSIAVYDQISGPISTHGHVNPPDAYGFSKWIGEQIVLSSSLEISIFRLAQTVHLDIPYRPVTWEFSASQQVEYVDSIHVITSLARALRQQRSSNRVDILGGGKHWQRTGQEVARSFEVALPGPPGNFSRNDCPGLGWYQTNATYGFLSKSTFSLELFCDALRCLLIQRANTEVCR